MGSPQVVVITGASEVVVITGASAGIVRATAWVFGARVFGARRARIGLLARGQAGLAAAITRWCRR